MKLQKSKRISKRGVLLGPDNNIEFLKYFMTIILKNRVQICNMPHFKAFTMRTNLLNWCNLVPISKNVVFYTSLVVRIY